MQLKIQALNKSHDKSSFDCGYNLLNNYIRTQAKQDVSRDLSACFVLSDDAGLVMGYYTLSANAINRDDLPSELNKKLPPSYINLPVILLGRLAVDNRFKGNHYGEVLLIDALKKCAEVSTSLGSLAIIVDPIDEKAVGFYERYGFVILPGSHKMFITLKTIRELFS